MATQSQTMPGRSLKALALRGSAWVVTGHAAGQLVRLARSLVLTRLLFPEAFGLMSLVWAIMYGLEMLSDVGLTPAIIRDQRGDDADFLNTAWTMQAMRGALLWIVACLLAYPIAAFYGKPELRVLIQVTSVAVLIAGLNSTALQTCRRHMEFGRVTLLELSNEVVALAATVLLTYVLPGVWALVGGALLSRFYLAWSSHVLLPGIRNRPRWEPAAARALFGFGKWIFPSSALQFISVQADRLMLGRYLTMSQLGVYSIALMLAEAIQVLVLRINHGVLYPAYARVAGQDVGRMRSVFYRTRLAIDVCLVLPLAAFTVLAEYAVALLYDSRYAEAGWMLQLLCIRQLMATVLTNGEACLIALGAPEYSLYQSASRAAWIVISIPTCWAWFGIKGVVWAVALTELPAAAVLGYGLAQRGVLSPMRELRSLSFAAAGLGVGFLLARVFA